LVRAVGPKDLPASVVARLHEAIVAVLARPDVRERLGVLGFDSIGSTPGEFARYINSEMGKYAKIIRDQNIKPE
jgi:tripartite-type tricarboxylate transporter receptor subunit TctC